MSPKRQKIRSAQSVVGQDARVFDPSLDYAGAFDYYKRYVIGNLRAKEAIYEQYGFKHPSGGTDDWEVFGAILVRDKATGGYGTDLTNHEVKSAKKGGSFEYQYHKHHGLQKLDEDAKVKHLFICYSNDCDDIEVWRVEGAQLAEIFAGWKAGYIQNYKNEKQRYRKNIAFGTVRLRGKLIMQIKDGQLAFPQLDTEASQQTMPSDL